MQLMFDLDGTLTDSRLGITRCIAHALAEVDAAVPPLDDLTRYVGPPLPASFASLLRTANAERIENAIRAYRRRFEDVGIFENCLYAGIADMLSAFSAAGHDMCVVTAKPRFYAVQILEQFRIDRFFRGVFGPDLSSRDYSKAALIRDACASVRKGAARVFMIGDRAEDVHGARSNGVGAVAVTWGYGGREELEAAQPDRLVASGEELVECIQAIG